MKRMIESALGIGLLLLLATAPAEAQAVRVDIGIRTPHVGARVVYGPRPVPHWRGHRHYRHPVDWSFVARFNAYELAMYREFTARHPRYRYDVRAHRRLRLQNRAAWEREFRRDQREAEREFRKWLREIERDRARPRRHRK